MGRLKLLRMRLPQRPTRRVAKYMSRQAFDSRLAGSPAGLMVGAISNQGLQRQLRNGFALPRLLLKYGQAIGNQAMYRLMARHRTLAVLDGRHPPSSARWMTFPGLLLSKTTRPQA